MEVTMLEKWFVGKENWAPLPMRVSLGVIFFAHGRRKSSAGLVALGGRNHAIFHPDPRDPSSTGRSCIPNGTFVRPGFVAGVWHPLGSALTDWGNDRGCPESASRSWLLPELDERAEHGPRHRIQSGVDWRHLGTGDYRERVFERRRHSEETRGAHWPARKGRLKECLRPDLTASMRLKELEAARAHADALLKLLNVCQASSLRF